MQNNNIQNLNWRYATKMFDSTKIIEKATLDEILESLRLSPSSFGIQPWKFLVVTSPELREKIKAVAWGQGQVTEASHLLVLCAKTDVSQVDVEKYINDVSVKRNVLPESMDGLRDMILASANKLSSEQKTSWNSKQVYLALGMMMMVAASLKIDTCPIEGFDAGKVDEILDLKKDGLTTVVLCPIGYRSADDKYATTTKVRYDKDKVIEFR